MAVAIMDEENDELLNDNLTADSDLLLISDVDDVSEMLQLVQSSRYLVDRERAISATQFHADIFLQTTPNSRFRTRARMDKDSFKLVVDEIKDNPVFYNRSPFAQAPVWLQLAVALDRFGHYGSGASLNRSQELWGIGKGTADDYTDRVIKALNELSSRGEYLLADSAYPADLTHNTIVPAHKSNSRAPTLQTTIPRERNMTDATKKDPEDLSGDSGVLKQTYVEDSRQEKKTVFDGLFDKFDINIGDEDAGKVVMQLDKDVAPNTPENFRAVHGHER
ncbi:hypothetical protein PR002_g8060 [Phytophthora rubi]|uniref:DDE Tnp4 domain-containing protein n=1 Tax=Phytophthora rubi TaxID=129364 RepID=A0A6A3MNS0_9STRA|nr:hypothetical protein PR002_g8060 [Phytophthora rubi]